MGWTQNKVFEIRGKVTEGFENLVLINCMCHSAARTVVEYCKKIRNDAYEKHFWTNLLYDTG